MNDLTQQRIALQTTNARLAAKATPIILMSGLLQEYMGLTSAMLNHINDLKQQLDEHNKSTSEPDAGSIRSQARAQTGKDNRDSNGTASPGNQAGSATKLAGNTSGLPGAAKDSFGLGR